MCGIVSFALRLLERVANQVKLQRKEIGSVGDR